LDKLKNKNSLQHFKDLVSQAQQQIWNLEIQVFGAETRTSIILLRAEFSGCHMAENGD
jgi:hypothetical protein